MCIHIYWLDSTIVLLRCIIIFKKKKKEREESSINSSPLGKYIYIRKQKAFYYVYCKQYNNLIEMLPYK
jgi:hypothetical protein